MKIKNKPSPPPLIEAAYKRPSAMQESEISAPGAMGLNAYQPCAPSSPVSCATPLTVNDVVPYGIGSTALLFALLHTRPSDGAMQRVEPFAPESRPCISPSYAVGGVAPLSNVSDSSYTFSAWGESGMGRSISIEAWGAAMSG